MRSKGKVISWDDDRGFGFIEPCLGGDKLFLHIKAFHNGGKRPEVGSLVVYTAAKDSQGRLQATKACFDGERLKKPKADHSSSLILLAMIFMGIVAVTTWLQKIPLIVLALYAIASLITFLIYACDKSAAKKERWRTRESTLHLLALIGGWPGAIVAQQLLNHKTCKRSFRTVFWLTVLLNCAAFLWLLTENAAPVKQVLITLTEMGMALL